jgi:putative transposase
VFLSPSSPTIVFLTVCTKNREPWLANHQAHTLLREIWTSATAWLVGRYMLMPDHLHLFSTPGQPELPLENWAKYWKSQFSKQHPNRAWRWQTDHWDTRLRREESYEEKWNYVVNNPVRRGLVTRSEDWPFQGEIFELRWD